MFPHTPLLGPKQLPRVGVENLAVVAAHALVKRIAYIIDGDAWAGAMVLEIVYFISLLKKRDVILLIVIRVSCQAYQACRVSRVIFQGNRGLSVFVMEDQ